MVVNRRGLDEAALDITSEVLKRVVSMPTKDFSGHVIGLEIIGVNENDIKVSYASNRTLVIIILWLGAKLLRKSVLQSRKKQGFNAQLG